MHSTATDFLMPTMPAQTAFDPKNEPKKRILLIEDNLADARLVEIFLDETDLISTKIIHRMSLREGIEAIRTGERFDAVMLDLTLPDSRGFETLERFMEDCPDQNVIVMTGLADKSLGLKAVQAGAQDFIVKGTLDSDQLGKSLRYAIERGAVLQRLEETQRIAHIGHWEFDLRGRRFTAGDEFFRILEARPEKKAMKEAELVGPLAFLNKIHAETSENGAVKRDMEIETGTGEARFVFIKCRREPSSEILYGVVQDISDRRRAEEQRKQFEVSQQAARMKEQFIASVSHEMRTPMNAILGMSNLVLGSDLDSEQRGYLQSIKQSSEILLGIVNDILEISTLQNGQIEFDSKAFDLPEVLFNLVNVMQYKISEKSLELRLEYADDVPKTLRGDKLRLNQILFNLVGNAIKFTDKGTVRIAVRKIGENWGRTTLEFEVEDSGIGIPSDQLQAIFESFTRVKHRDRLFEGTGLGLSIARNLVLQQGGKIWASSEVGKGSTFFFQLAFEPATEAEAEKMLAPSGPKKDFDPTRAIRLLLVEDHKMNQIVARKTLERQFPAAKITVAENGREAIAWLEKEPFDLVLMDIQMPVMDGEEATAHIRANMPEVSARTPILAMTAHAHISKDRAFRQVGFDDFVLKPFEPQQLFDKILEYVF